MMVARTTNGLGDIPRASDRKKPRYVRPLTPKQAKALAMYDDGATLEAIGKALGWKNGKGVRGLLDAAMDKLGRPDGRS